MERFKKIDNIKEYVNEIISDPTRVIHAKKTQCVLARRGIIGETVNSYTNGILETTNKVGFGKDGEIDWVLTKLDNKDTSWVVSNDFFINNYDLKNDNVYIPKGTINTFIKVDENISFYAPWGEEMFLIKGGFLKITNLNDITGIQENDFFDTYTIL